jgi:hypothetical protein
MGADAVLAIVVLAKWMRSVPQSHARMTERWPTPGIFA